jgi:hypothetical protein
MELRLLWISTVLLGKTVGVFAWTRPSIPTTTHCRSTETTPSSRLVLWEHVGSQTYYEPLQDVQVQDDNAVTEDAAARVETTSVSTATAVPTRNRASWMDRVQQLQEYSATHGNTLVPKRYKKNPTLGNWVNKQRQNYRKFLRGQEPCSLTSQHVDILNSVGFCWDASNVTTTESTRDDAWWSRFKEF